MQTRASLTRNFFKLEGDCPDFDEKAFMALVHNRTVLCKDRLYRPDTLKSSYRSGHQRVRGIRFCNVSFSRTEVTGFEFTDCIFERCLFLSTTFSDCRFTSCSFVDCNPYRLEFDGCYVDPASFENCILNRQYSNIGIYLFQELLRNSRQQAQPDFSDEAQYLFRRWQRYQLWQELRGPREWFSKWQTCQRLARLQAFELISGSGVRLGKLINFAFITLLLFTMINWLFAIQFGLTQNGHVVKSLIDAFYFSTVVTTTLGFGDITPTTASGRFAVSIEAIVGFVLFALVTSTMYRKLSS